MREGVYQARLIVELRGLFPGCVLLKNDSSYQQGIPDLIVLYKDTWAVLEVKASLHAPNQPNQEYYIDRLNEMSFAAFICPENHEEVIYDLRQAFHSLRTTRLSKR